MHPAFEILMPFIEDWEEKIPELPEVVEKMDEEIKESMSTPRRKPLVIDLTPGRTPPIVNLTQRELPVVRSVVTVPVSAHVKLVKKGGKKGPKRGMMEMVFLNEKYSPQEEREKEEEPGRPTERLPDSSYDNQQPPQHTHSFTPQISHSFPPQIKHSFTTQHSHPFTPQIQHPFTPQAQLSFATQLQHPFIQQYPQTFLQQYQQQFIPQHSSPITQQSIQPFIQHHPYTYIQPYSQSVLPAFTHSHAVLPVNHAPHSYKGGSGVQQQGKVRVVTPPRCPHRQSCSHLPENCPKMFGPPRSAPQGPPPSRQW